MSYDSVHLTLQLIRDLKQDFNISGISHDFALFGCRNNDKDAKYEELEKELSIGLYYIETEKALSMFLKNKKHYSILIHGDSYTCIKQAVRANNHVSWVCWGYIPKKGKKFILSGISFLLRKHVYKRLKNIVCLLSSDKKELWNNYNLSNLIVLPYWGNNNYDELNKFIDTKYSHKPLNVYVGNSGHNYQSYLKILPLLVKYKGLIKVHVMFQYPDWPEKKELVKKVGCELFGEDFVLDETMMEIENYRDYMSQCDVYICGDKSQTGLGAIHFSLYIGTKVFITGNNLEWEKMLGAYVFDVDDIRNMSFSSFSRELLPVERDHNKDVMVNLWNQNDNWIDFFKNKC